MLSDEATEKPAKLQSIEDGGLHKRRMNKLNKESIGSPARRLQMTNIGPTWSDRPAEQRSAEAQSTERNFLISFEDLQYCLYRSNETQPVPLEQLRQAAAGAQSIQENIFWCDICGHNGKTPCSLHGIRHCRKTQRSVERKETGLTAAVESFPDEVEICQSSIPGAGYGVRTKRIIPMGTWIGPYEGKQVRAQQITPDVDTSYMWEISHEGRLAYFLDGRDESCSSWMRFIQCARHKGEQNMFAFQYMGNIYYRAYKDIPEGAELLVWYDDSYPQYMGIPLEIKDTAPVGSGDPNQHGEMLVVVPHSIPRPPHRTWQPAPVPQGLVGQATRPPFPLINVPPEKMALRPVHIKYGQEAPEMLLAGRKLSSSEAQSALFPPLSSASTDTVTQATKSFDTTDTPRRSDSESSTKTEDMMHSPKEVEVKSEESEFGVFRCGQCGKSFNQRSVLQIHVCPRMPHRPYHCGHCNESFSHPNDLRNHAAIHSSEKPFKCGYCQRSFSGATTLNNHIRTHTGEKPFICERCGKSFTQASQLGKHQKIPGDCID